MPEVGDFVELRGRRWLVEAADPKGSDLAAVRLSCISDDAQGEALEVLWDAEIGAQSLDDDSWRQVGRGASRRYLEKAAARAKASLESDGDGE